MVSIKQDGEKEWRSEYNWQNLSNVFVYSSLKEMKFSFVLRKDELCASFSNRSVYVSVQMQ